MQNRKKQMAEGGAFCYSIKKFLFLKRSFSLKKAFTLAEVLVTLSIIGVVSAMTIPTLVRNNQEHQTIAKLKATYSILSQAMKVAEMKNGPMDEWTTERWTEKGASDIAEKLLPYFKVLKDCGTFDEKKECVNSEYLQKNGNKHDISYATDRRYYKILLKNGSALIWKATDPAEANLGIYTNFYVDVNNSAPPNKYGRDFFIFSYEEGKIMPYGSPIASNNSYTNSCLPKNSTGWGCAYYVLTKGKMDY